MQKETKEALTGVEDSAVKTKKDGKRRFPKRGARESSNNDGGYRRQIKGGNDFSFWNKYPDLIKDSANLIYSYLPGTKFECANHASFVPGNVTVIEFAPSINPCEPGRGDSDRVYPFGLTSNNAVNVQVRKLWLDMHRKYRGIGSYQQADLGMAILAITNVFSQVAKLERLYGLSYSYSAGDRLFPKKVLQALRYKDTFISSLGENLADFRYGINRLIEKCSQLCLPKGLSLLMDQASLNGFVYKDSKETRFNIFLYDSPWYGFYESTLTTTGGGVVYARIENERIADYKEALSVVDTMVERLLGDDDITRMCSDLLAAYKDTGVDKLATMPEDYRILPMYSESMILKFHNLEVPIKVRYDTKGQTNTEEPVELSSLMPADITTSASLDNVISHIQTDVAGATATMQIDSAYYIYQSENVIRFVPCFIDSTHHMDGNFLIDATLDDTIKVTQLNQNKKYIIPQLLAESSYESHWQGSQNTHVVDTWEDAISIETVVEACQHKINVRAVYAASTGHQGNQICLVTSCSTIIPLKLTAMALAGDAITSFQLGTYFYSVPSAAYDVSFMNLLSQFDWHPILWQIDELLNTDSEVTVGTIEGVFGDLDHSGPITELSVARIHDASIMSAFKFDIAISGSDNG